MGAETTNGDGFGLGWYTPGQEQPGRYRSVNPAWNDENLRDLASHVESPLFLAHIRAAVGSPVQQTNCHPFRHGRWLFVHNGLLHGFHDMRRDLLLAVEPPLFEGISGSADSELLFYLALTFGFEDDPSGRGARDRARRGDGRGARYRVPVPGNGGLQRRRAALGGALLERAQLAQPVHLARRKGRARAPPRQPATSGPCRRDPRDRVRASQRLVGRLARGTRVDRAGGPGGRRRTAAGSHPAGRRTRAQLLWDDRPTAARSCGASCASRGRRPARRRSSARRSAPPRPRGPSAPAPEWNHRQDRSAFLQRGCERLDQRPRHPTRVLRERAFGERTAPGGVEAKVEQRHERGVGAPHAQIDGLERATRGVPPHEEDVEGGRGRGQGATGLRFAHADSLPHRTRAGAQPLARRPHHPIRVTTANAIGRTPGVRSPGGYVGWRAGPRGRVTSAGALSIGGGVSRGCCSYQRA